MWTGCTKSARTYQASSTLWLRTSCPPNISGFAINNHLLLVITYVFNAFSSSFTQATQAYTVFTHVNSDIVDTISNKYTPFTIYANTLIETVDSTITISPTSTASLAIIRHHWTEPATTQYRSLVTLVYTYSKAGQRNPS